MVFKHCSFHRGSLWVNKIDYIRYLFIIIICFIFVGCGQISSTSTPDPNQSIIAQSTIPIIATNSPTETLTPLPSASPTQPTISVWLPPYLPEKLRMSFTLPNGYSQATTYNEASIEIDVVYGDTDPVIQWIYALVTPFPTITDGITSEQLRSVWKGNESSPINEVPILMDEGTFYFLVSQWGPPMTGAWQVLPTDEILDYAWSNQPAWAILPFENLDPRWKVLTIDGQSPVRKDFDPSRYPLTIPFVISGDERVQPEFFNLPRTNRDASKLTTVAMTGVTAMVRATAFTMEAKGITYPAQDIGPILVEADITHISNEIPFSPDCPFPNPASDFLVFCSNPSYIDLLKAVGTDIVELTGDHFMDYGSDATLYTLQMYDDLGWPYYGGGTNADEARQPILLEHNGNKIAFMGCNVGCQVKNEIPCDAIATDNHPGAAQCDFNWISDEISRLRDDGYQVIFTFQHREYYTYTAQPILAYDFSQVAAAGASIVSGSQAHQPHGFAFDDDAFIHYGLGNLFFDQFHFCADYACDDAFIDQHVFYDGQYISTELITIRFADLARPRLMTPEERSRFLAIIFNASGW